MKIHYLIDGKDVDYIAMNIDFITQMASLSYVINSLELQRTEVSIADVLNDDPTINPQLHIAKKGNIWDLHVWKINSYGEEIRRSAGILLSHEPVITDVKFINEDKNDWTLKNYATQPLAVYNSPLMVNKYEFNNTNNLTGNSGNGSSDVLVDKGKLKLGYQSQVTIPMFSGGTFNLSEFPFSMAFKISTLASNTATNSENFVLELGSNVLSFKQGLGVVYSNTQASSVIFPPAVLAATSLEFALHIGEKTLLEINGDYHEIPGFIKNQVVNSFTVGSLCNAGEYTLLDHVVSHASHAYKLDSKPPQLVLGITIEPQANELLVRWDKNNDADLKGYNVYVNGVKNNIVLITDNTYRIMDLTNDLSYSVSVTAVDESGNESPTFNTVRATPADKFDKIPPAIPIDLAVIDIGGELEATWHLNGELDLDGYNIYVDGVKHNKVLIKDAPYIIDKLEFYKDYEITISAVDVRNNESSQSIAVNGFVEDPDAVEEVTNVTYTNTVTTVSLKWDNPLIAEFERCNIYRNDVFVGMNTAPMYDDIGLSSGTYVYRIEVVTANGRTSAGTEVTVILT